MHVITVLLCCVLEDRPFECTNVSGQLSETLQLLIKSQPMFIAQTSGLHHLIAHCLVSLETEFQFHDTFRCKMIVKILERMIGELLDSDTNYCTALLSCAFLRTNYWTGHQVLLITSLRVIGSLKDFCRKFSYVSTVSGRSSVPKTVVVFALLIKQYTRISFTV